MARSRRPKTGKAKPHRENDRVRLARIEVIFFDFDGVLTDNRVWVLENGQEAVLCNRADGQGFNMLAAAGVKCMIVSTETNPVVAHRARKLKLPVRQGVKDKGLAVRELCRELRVTLENTAFVGNDVNDLPGMAVVGFALCPCDAAPEVRAVCDVVLKTAGGAGVVREIAARLT